MTAKQQETVRRGYDEIADEYVAHIADELKDKPFDRELLDRFAARLQGAGPVCDLGCGPGHVARYLQDRGTDVFGVDLSPGKIAAASRLHPRIRFQQGNMLALEIANASLAAVLSFYAIVNLPRADVNIALGEMSRVLQRDGLLQLAFHAGDEMLHRDESWRKPVDLDFLFFRTSDIEAALVAAGFEIEDLPNETPTRMSSIPAGARTFWRSAASYFFSAGRSGLLPHSSQEPSYMRAS
jgi:ubiquinone/menaquinone biosynthesis C-methylase UbiE